MKLQLKLTKALATTILFLGSAAPLVNNIEVTVIASATTEKVTLGHAAYVYNKDGKRLKKGRGNDCKTYFKKGDVVKVAETVQPIKNDSKRYYLLDDNKYDQSWLPYTKIHGKYYYKINSGNYIKAANVWLVNNKLLYNAEATVKVRNSKKDKSFVVGTGKNKTKIIRGKKYPVDAITAIFDDHGGNSNTPTRYRISGTADAFLPADEIEKRPQHNLKIYTKDTYVSFNQKTGTYDAHGVARPTDDLRSFFSGNDLYPVEELTYLWVPSENKAELFFLLKDSWNKPSFFTFSNFLNTGSAGLLYIKATNAEYLSGPYLKPTNTPQQAQADAKTAITEDKKDLQSLVDQEKISPYRSSSLNRICDRRFNYALEFAKTVLNSDKATVAEVKKATAILTKAQEDVLNCTTAQEETDEILNQTTPYVYERQY